MAVTVTSAERVKSKGIGIGGGPHGGNGRPGKNGHGSGGGGGQGDHGAKRFSTQRYRITIWVVLAAVGMTFAALTSAYTYIALSSGTDWRPLAIPGQLWVSTGLILVSSVTFRAARKSLTRGSDKGYSRWLLLTLVLGLGFLGSQLLAWRQLVAQGVYLATTLHSSFFYFLTGVHGIHLLGGILALDYLLLRTRHRRNNMDAEMKRQAAASLVSVYWHFMDGLWIFLFLLLFLWR